MAFIFSFFNALLLNIKEEIFTLKYIVINKNIFYSN